MDATDDNPVALIDCACAAKLELTSKITSLSLNCTPDLYCTIKVGGSPAVPVPVAAETANTRAITELSALVINKPLNNDTSMAELLYVG